MESRHFQAQRLPNNNGYSWTLVSRLGDMLHQAEQRFGQRDQSWTILGVEFYGETPKIWYPGDRKHVAVQLGQKALDDTVQACYQLAHECVHLLSPSGQSIAPVLEEGLATVYSEDYVLAHFGVPMLPTVASYQEAAMLVRELLSIDPDAIKRLREFEPAFHMMDEDTFKKAGLDVPSGLVSQLIQPFDR